MQTEEKHCCRGSENPVFAELARQEAYEQRVEQMNTQRDQMHRPRRVGE